MWSSVPPLPAAATKDLCRAALPSPATTSCCCRSWLRPWRQDGRRDADKGPMSLFDDNPGPRGEVGDLQDHLADVSESPSARWSCKSRSEEHTSELQSHSDLVCRLLLEKKKKDKITRYNITKYKV